MSTLLKQYTTILRVIFVLVLFLVPALSSAAEVIDRFDATIAVHADGSFTVTEEITYDFGGAERRGIFRYVPTTHPQESSSWLSERYVDITVQDVLRNNAPEPHEISREREQLYIKIGDPNETHTGEQVYTITYDVRGGLSYDDLRSEAELYWNVTGTDWEVPILRTNVTLTSEQEGIFLPERSCYQGLEFGTGSCVIEKSTSSEPTFTARTLLPGKGVTIAQAIKGSAVDELILERSKRYILMIGGLLLWFGALTIFVYRYRTKHRIDRPVIAQYEPYENFKPMYTGLLFDGRLDPKDITAAIVYLAEQGYLKIEQIDRKVLFFFSVDDYRITLTRDPKDIEHPYQKDILRMLFSGALKADASVTLGDLKDDLSKQKHNQHILKELKKDLERELEQDGFFEINIPKRYIMTLVIGLVFGGVYFGGYIATVLSTYVQNGAASPSPLFFVLFVVGTAVILAFMYRRRTVKGYEALNHLEGFAQFLSVTEKERYAFHNAPKKSPEQFMQYLPYAIAFGVEEEWAEVFKDVTIPDPEWYSGGGSGAHFSATALTQSLGSFSSAFASSSGSSASSGGGSVGGGAGGGGGGSW